MDSLPIPVNNALRISEAISEMRDGGGAPQRRLWHSARSFSRSTFVKPEKGDPAVAIGRHAAVLLVLGRIDRLRELAEPIE